MSDSKAKSTGPDKLVKPSKKTEIELSESELSRVSGGDTNKASSGPSESLSLNFTKVEYKY